MALIGNKYLRMHPFTKIMCFLCLLLMVGRLDGFYLATLLAGLVLLNLILKVKSFVKVLLRMRWLFVSMLCIYAWGTPGELLGGFPTLFAPTYEGLNTGLVQLQKLLIALAGLGLLVTGIPREEMILGLHILLSPLKWLGFDMNKFSVRLMLTFQYVEELAQYGREKFNIHVLDHVEQELSMVNSTVVLPQKPWSKLDQCVLLLLAIVFIVGFIGV